MTAKSEPGLSPEGRGGVSTGAAWQESCELTGNLGGQYLQRLLEIPYWPLKGLTRGDGGKKGLKREERLTDGRGLSSSRAFASLLLCDQPNSQVYQDKESWGEAPVILQGDEIGIQVDHTHFTGLLKHIEILTVSAWEQPNTTYVGHDARIPQVQSFFSQLFFSSTKAQV